MHQFDLDTEVKFTSPHDWQGKVSKNWFFGSAPHGGYMMSMAARAMSQLFSQDEYKHTVPVSITATFVEQAAAGDVNGTIEVQRRGKRFTQAVSKVMQDGRPCLQLVAVYGAQELYDGEVCSDFVAPIIPCPQECVPLSSRGIPFRDQVETRLVPEDARYFPNGGKEQMELLGWVRFTDGRQVDLVSLAVFADAFPRATVLRTGVTGWIPSLDLTIQCMGIPAPGFIATRFRSRMLGNGLLEEQGELWDSDGKLVAVCRQSAIQRRKST